MLAATSAEVAAQLAEARAAADSETKQRCLSAVILTVAKRHRPLLKTYYGDVLQFLVGPLVLESRRWPPALAPASLHPCWKPAHCSVTERRS